MRTKHLFVYGSLLSGFQLESYEYIRRYFNLIGEAAVKGTMYDMGDYPVVTRHDTGRFIKGELYEVRHPEEFSFALAQLDDYEGLYPEEGVEVLYDREAVDVYMNGEVIDAWIYWYNGDISGRTIVESGDMREYARGNKS